MSSTSYGQPAGLSGINCGYKKYPFVDGVNFQSYFPYDEKENAERYKEFQKQREMERNIRKTSREADMLKEAGDEEGAKDARKRLAAQRKAYKEYSAEHGLKPHNDRTSVARMAKGQDTFGDVYKDYGKTVDKSRNGGIIEAGSDTLMDVLTRKSKPDSYVVPMPKKQFRNIKKAFQRQGGIIQQNDETDSYLETKHAEGITYDAKTILLKKNPSRASVFEELIHATQYRKGKNDGSTKSRLLNEIEAQEKLLKYAQAYKLTESEIEQTKNALKRYQEELKTYVNLHGGD